jgi:hypothetical protein
VLIELPGFAHAIAIHPDQFGHGLVVLAVAHAPRQLLWVVDASLSQATGPAKGNQGLSLSVPFEDLRIARGLGYARVRLAERNEIRQIALA